MWVGMGLAQLGAGLAQEAVTSFKRGVELAPWYVPGAWLLAAAYHQAGERELGQEWARKLAGSDGHSYHGAAIYYAAAGEVDAMFEALEGAYRQRDGFFISIHNERFFDRYRADPRFRALLAKMNLA
jgi:hypothetical protein